MSRGRIGLLQLIIHMGQKHACSWARYALGQDKKRQLPQTRRPSGDFSPFPPFSSKSPLSKFHPIWIASCLAIFAIIAIACISGHKWDGWGNPPVHIISHFNLITFTRYVGWAAIHVTSPIWGPPVSPPPPPPHHVNRLLGIYVKIAEFPQEKRVGPSSLCSPVAGVIIFFSASRIWRT